MNNKERYMQPSINIKELLYYIVVHWRYIFVVMFSFCVVMAGVSYVKSYRAIDAHKKEIEEKKEMSIEEYVDSLSWDESTKAKLIDVVETLDSHQASYDGMAFYLKNSVLMNLDASQVSTYTMSYYVDNKQVVQYPNISESNNTTAIVQALIGYLYTDELQKEVYDIIGEKSVDYITEIIDCSFGTGNNGSFVVNIYYRDEDSVRKISEIVKNRLKEAQKELVVSFGEFDLILGADQYYLGANADLLDKQRVLANNMANILDTMTKTKNALSDDEKECYDKIIEFRNTTENSAKKDNKDDMLQPEISKKWTFVGMLLGIFFMCFVYLCSYLWGNKLKTEDNFLQNNVKVLGVIRMKNKKRIFFRFVDTWINVLFGKKETKDLDDTISLIATKILVKAETSKKIVLTGCAFSEKEKQITEKLCEKLKVMGLEITVAPSMMNISESLLEAGNSEMIIFIEEINHSHVSEIEEQIAFSHEINKDIAGVIVVA